MSHTQILLDQIDVVKLDIALWTSSKKLRKEDLVLATGSQLPPEELAHLGTKKTIDPQTLKGFHRIKKEAERICLEKGTRFLGGYANPKAEIPRIIEELEQLAPEFYRERDRFIANYEQETESWIQQNAALHPSFGDAIRRAIEPATSVAAKLRFDYVVFHVNLPEVIHVNDDDPVPVDHSLTQRTHSLSDQLFYEIGQDAHEMVKRSFVGKDRVTGKVLNAFRRIRNKLNSLGFLDHRCMPVVDQIDAVLETLPKSGPYNGSAFHDLFRLGMLLSNPGMLKQHGGGLLQNDAQDDEVEDEAILDSNVSVSDPDTQTPSSLFDTVIESVQNLPDKLETTREDDLADFDAFLETYQNDWVGENSCETDMTSNNLASLIPERDESDAAMDDYLPNQSKQIDQPKAADFWF